MNTHDSMPRRVYAPAMDARENVFKIAADQPVSLYGVTAPNALAAPGPLSFGEFVRRPETLALYGSPSDSDASCLLLELREAFVGNATRKDLEQFVRATHSGKPRGFRYWNRLAASIWKNYQGLQGAKERTGKAHDGEVTRLVTAAERAHRETKRSSLRRVPKSEPEKHALSIAKLRARAHWLDQRAEKKLTEAQQLQTDADKLRAERDALHARASQLEQDSSRYATRH